VGHENLDVLEDHENLGGGQDNLEVCANLDGVWENFGGG